MLDDETDGIQCTVRGIRGRSATLTSVHQFTPHLRERLAPGSLGFLVFDHRGLPAALRGAARADGDGQTIEFLVLDGIEMPERRQNPRLPAAFPVRVSPAPSEAPAVPVIETVSIDLSSTGARLAITPGLDVVSRCGIELVLSPQRPICCRAVMARHDPTDVAVAFTDMPDSDRARLTDLLRERQRPVGSGD
jgi:hypothetical protein